MKIPKRLEPLIEEGMIDDVLCQLMTGKAGMIYMVRCGNDIRCAKVYKETNKRNFLSRFSFVALSVSAIAIGAGVLGAHGVLS